MLLSHLVYLIHGRLAVLLRLLHLLNDHGSDQGDLRPQGFDLRLHIVDQLHLRLVEPAAIVARIALILIREQLTLRKGFGIDAGRLDEFRVGLDSGILISFEVLVLLLTEEDPGSAFVPSE